MRAVLQRVAKASVAVDGVVIGEIDSGLLVFLGVKQGDGEADIEWLVNKILNLRIFEDNAGKMNLSVQDIEGQILVVSQFTLYANCMRGRRPDFIEAAEPQLAEDIYNKFIETMKKSHKRVETGQFAAKMEIELINDGPVTIILEK
jgi:D-tyrosyl-tRNA(Tyr) deacylase